MKRRDYLQGAAFSMVSIGLAGCSGKLEEETTTQTTKTGEQSSGEENQESENDQTTEKTTQNPDSDSDGVPDSEDEYPNDATRSKDSGGDSVADSEDDFPNDPERTTDSDRDGVADSEDDFPDDTLRTTDSDGDGVADLDDEFPDDPTRSQLLLSENDTRKVEEDYWRYYELNCEDDCQLEYDFTVRDGPSIDAIVMEQSEYSYFKDGSRFRAQSGLTTYDSTSGSVKKTLLSGDYCLIFDNSNNGVASPPTNFSNDVATIDFDIVLTK